MNILVINCGSSSIKYKLFDFPSEKLITSGNVERIGTVNSTIQNHSEGVHAIIKELLSEKIINSPEDIAAIGHRVVHGGETFFKPCLIDDKVIKKIEQCCAFAPLHNPANLAGIKACAENFTKTKEVAVFDTAFHHTLPDYAYMYAIPYSYYEKCNIRKYGFHGTSHQYVAGRAAEMLKKPIDKLKLITCHLGNGCSITAIKNGQSIDTSMGFTPLEGLMMGTRCGDIDTAAVFHLMHTENISSKDMDTVLNRKSGLLGVSGVSNDMREILNGVKEGNKRCKLAYDMFIYRIKKYIGSYYFILGGADAICLTAGIGENNIDLFDNIKKHVGEVFPKKTKVIVVKTNEELMIAQLTYNLIK